MSGLRVLLASQSPRRRELLALIGLAHDVRPADIDESLHPGEAPVAHAERLAREKAKKISGSDPDAVVIAADTIVVLDGDVLGKPADTSEAMQMLSRLSGRTHTVLTAVAVARGADMRSGVETVEVTFRELTRTAIERYVATREPMDKAGAYGIQGYGATIVRRIEGDYFAVMGLALGRMVELLDELGVRYEHPGVLTHDAGRKRQA